MEFEDKVITTEEYGAVLFKMDNGVHGVFYVSEVSAGRGCYFNFEVDGSKASMQWNQETGDHVWMGFRDEDNRQIMRNPNNMYREAKQYSYIAKGGVVINPEELSENELERLSRAYIENIAAVIGPKKDIPAPDVNTNSKIMGWMLDEYSRLTGKVTFEAITGKPIKLGGSKGRTEATGYGVALMARQALKLKNIDIKGAKVSIQGFGNVGSYAAEYMQSFGATIVAIQERNSCIYNLNGVKNVNLLREHLKINGTITGFEQCESLERDEFFKIPVDVFIPAALENQITCENANSINAKIICEGANGPTTLEADRILNEKGVMIVPDILANAGGVIVSYFEWVQNIMKFYWDKKEIQEKQNKIMDEAFENLLELMKKYNIDMRTAGYVKSISSIAEAMTERGWC